MYYIAVLMLCIVCASSIGAEAAEEVALTWHDAKTLTFEGRGWSDTPSFYDRFPAKAQAMINEAAWWRSHDSAGMLVRFVSDSPEISARWKVTNATLDMNHMPSSGVSGVDLYVRYKGEWQWLAIGIPSGQESEKKLIAGLPREKREYSLYLPLYNGVTSLEIGVPEGSTVTPAPPRTRDIKPVVFYGTSILQGGCASRPGMAYPSIIGRRLDVPTINLGFSGSGRLEQGAADLLAELDPSVYVIDALPNMYPDWIEERFVYLLKVLKEKRPNTPVILVEDAPNQSIYSRVSSKPRSKSTILAKVYKDNAKQWGGKLYYVKGDKLVGTDGEGTVDGVHATDLGFQRMADALTPVVKKVLDKHSAAK